MTRMHQNQSLGSLISLIIWSSLWQFVAFPYIQEVWKATKLYKKNLAFNSVLLIPTVSISHFHLTNLFFIYCQHIPTNSVAPFSAYKPTHNPQFHQSLWRANTQNISFLNSLWWPIYVNNSVDNTKLPCYTLPLMQHSFFRNLSPSSL